MPRNTDNTRWNSLSLSLSLSHSLCPTRPNWRTLSRSFRRFRKLAISDHPPAPARAPARRKKSAAPLRTVNSAVVNYARVVPRSHSQSPTSRTLLKPADRDDDSAIVHDHETSPVASSVLQLFDNRESREACEARRRGCATVRGDRRSCHVCMYPMVLGPFSPSHKSISVATL